jgi:prepilin-type N-terminal cleavage/methylation domain-containing protein/prepilin-type processing-associated H-X9-DG protein
MIFFSPIPKVLQSQRHQIRGFSLVELLVAIAVLSILIAISIAGLNATKNRASSAQSISNFREIHAAIALFVVNNNGEFPRSRTFIPEGGSGSAWGYEGGFWFNAIGEYLDEGRQFRQELVGTGPWPQNIPFACPSIIDRNLHGWGGAGIDVGLNGYLFPAGTPPSPRVLAANVQNPSQALLVADSAAPGTGVGSWQVGHGGAFSANSIAFRHNGRATILHVDGSIKQMKRQDLTPDVINRLAGR